MAPGKLYGIGVGPGDPELLTLKAMKILKSIDVLFIPKSREDKRSLAYSIVSDVIDKDWECIDLILPMTRDQELLNWHWQRAARDVISILNRGRDAAFITLGDPGMYSTFGYLLKNIREVAPGIEVQIIPGVSSIHSISAWLQEPLAEGEESLAILPAFNDKDKISAVIEQFDNTILLKAANQIDQIRYILDEKNVPGQIYLASRCGFPDGFISTDLNSLEGHKLDYLSTIVIKKKKKED